jgi:hypothetical protein
MAYCLLAKWPIGVPAVPLTRFSARRVIWRTDWYANSCLPVQKLGGRLANKCSYCLVNSTGQNRRQANNCIRNKSLGLLKADSHP